MGLLPYLPFSSFRNPYNDLLTTIEAIIGVILHPHLVQFHAQNVI